jgi:hypothetical protein
MKLNALAIQDKKIFSKFLGINRHTLSVYAFENIYIWKKLFQIRWAIIEGNLCIFFRDRIGCFLYLPPLGEQKKPAVIRKAFRIMDSFNKGNKEISRIENIEAVDLAFFRSLGYVCQEKSRDYLCLREDLVRLRGNRFKSKRSCLNYFIKHYQFEYLPFTKSDTNNCLALYNAWMVKRVQNNTDPPYRWMLRDSLNCLKVLLRDCRGLDITARVVKIGLKIKGFTFGFRLNPYTFCILYETTDLSIKGLAQFIFRQFCQELKGYRYINVMDDSGLENLKQVKLSYHPIRLIPAYIAKRCHA